MRRGVFPIRGRERTGFSSLELLGVMCVIALIASLILAWGLGAHERSREMSCQSNLKQISHALQLYADDHGGRLPASEDALGNLASVYMRNWQLFKCPCDSEPRPEPLETPQGLPSDPAKRVLAHEGTNYPVSYFVVPGLAADDPPKTVVAGDIVARHRGGWNAVYLDGHTDWRPASELAAHMPKGATSDAD